MSGKVWECLGPEDEDGADACGELHPTKKAALAHAKTLGPDWTVEDSDMAPREAAERAAQAARARIAFVAVEGKKPRTSRRQSR